MLRRFGHAADTVQYHPTFTQATGLPRWGVLFAARYTGTKAVDTSSRPYFTEQYRSSSGGVNVDAAVNQLYTLMAWRYEAFKTFTLRGPPGCGKTTVLRSTANKHPMECVYYKVPGAALRAWEGNKTAFFDKVNLIDEAQALPEYPGFDEFLADAREAPKPTVFSGTFSHVFSPGSGCWLFLDGRFGDKDQTSKWFRDGLHSLGLTVTDSFVSYCIAVTDCHAPLLNNIGYFLQEERDPYFGKNRHDILSAEKKQVELVMEAIRDHRLFRKNGKNAVAGCVKPIVEDIVTVGSAETTFDHRAVRTAVTGGLFVPITQAKRQKGVREQQNPGPLCIVEQLSSDVALPVQLAHPAQWSLCEPIHEIWSQQHPMQVPSCPIDVLLATLPCLPPAAVQDMYFHPNFLPNQRTNDPVTCLEGETGSPREDRQKTLFRTSLRTVADRCGWSLTEEDEPKTGAKADSNRNHRYDLKLTLGQTDIGLEFLCGHRSWGEPYTHAKKKSGPRVPVKVSRSHAHNLGDDLSFIGDFAEHHLRWEMPSFSGPVAAAHQCMTVAFLGPSFDEVGHAQITELETAIDNQREHLKKQKLHAGTEVPWCVVHFVSHANIMVWYKPSGGQAKMHRVVGNGVPQRFDTVNEVVVALQDRKANITNDTTGEQEEMRALKKRVAALEAGHHK